MLAFEATRSFPCTYSHILMQPVTSKRYLSTFTQTLKLAVVLHILKKPNLHPASLDYKLRDVARRYLSHNTDHHLLASNLSAYCPFHSAKRALQCVHDDLIKDNSHVSLLAHHDGSSAFHTVDHKILLSILAERFC